MGRRRTASCCRRCTAAHKAGRHVAAVRPAAGQALQLVSAGGDNTLVVVEPATSRKTRRRRSRHVLPYRSGDVAKLGVSADGKHVLFDHGNGAARAVAGRPAASRACIRAPPARRQLHDDGPVLAGRQDDPDQQRLGRPAAAVADAGRLAGDDQAAPPSCASSSGTAGHGHLRRLRPGRPAFVVTGTQDSYVLVWAMPKAEEVRAAAATAKLSLVERVAGHRRRARCASGPSCKTTRQGTRPDARRHGDDGGVRRRSKRSEFGVGVQRA